MNRNLRGRLAAGALVALASLGAQAQSSGPAAAASSTASSTMSAKEAKAANRKLQKDVIRVLARTKGLSVTHITVRANNGAVTLEGAVPEQAQIDLATSAAKGVPGVLSVRNTLTLSTF
ncbi:BON domain-containing protein [Paraburkholderia sp. HD33-4]|uniref:BON domain-containing protein n=1 Tax=Paraburkholderia sp. HD33-4 TaxID=2883242 RepID=UPI001F28A794|nr:BON domain-containing protein [Paraburkholderia sp. HD33-4]